MPNQVWLTVQGMNSTVYHHYHHPYNIIIIITTCIDISNTCLDWNIQSSSFRTDEVVCMNVINNTQNMKIQIVIKSEHYDGCLCQWMFIKVHLNTWLSQYDTFITWTTDERCSLSARTLACRTCAVVTLTLGISALVPLVGIMFTAFAVGAGTVRSSLALCTLAICSTSAVAFFRRAKFWAFQRRFSRLWIHLVRCVESRNWQRRNVANTLICVVSVQLNMLDLGWW